jgi:hypothetical protein
MGMLVRLRYEDRCDAWVQARGGGVAMTTGKTGSSAISVW